MTKRFHKACADYQLIEEGDHILIGLSGGKDSLALVEFLGRRSKVYVPRFRVTAIHVRPAMSEGELPQYESNLSYLQHFCDEWGVPLVVRESGWNPQTESTGKAGNANPCFLCSWYRRKALFAAANELGCNKIALGHHKDDIVETMLMNLVFQGAFCSIPPKLQMEKMPIQMVRPLCLMEEKDLIRYAALRGYERQKKVCPFEHESSRSKVKGLLAQLKALNPEAMDSMWGAMSNIKQDYLPHQV